jgi:hypothetical protein
MRTELAAELETRRMFLKNRAAFPIAELAPYKGLWIAWSPEGSRVVAQSRDPESLDEQILAAGEDPEQCVVEGIPANESMLGGDGLGPVG